MRERRRLACPATSSLSSNDIEATAPHGAHGRAIFDMLGKTNVENKRAQVPNPFPLKCVIRKEGKCVRYILQKKK